MILIVSEESDHSTANVIDWLIHYKKQWIRLNGEAILNPSLPFEFNTGKREINVGGTVIEIDKLSAIWYRRDAPPVIPSLGSIASMPYTADIKSHLRREVASAKSGIYDLLQENIRTLGRHDSISLNKINCLHIARSCGLDIPATMITGSKQTVEQFKSDHGRIITKSITNTFDLKIANEEGSNSFSHYTEEVTAELLEEMPESFFPSLFQELVEKELEIRTFFLDGKCYSMAIFSQLDKQTSVDYRKYNREKSNRAVAYQLPGDIEAKISDLMNKCSLNIGSLDIILSKDGKHFFLEINPVGQYWTHSVICNYNLDKRIAEFLIKE